VRVALAVVALLASALGRASTPWWQVSDALDFTPHGTQPGLAYPLSSSDSCKSCHASSTNTDPAFFPWNTWSGSMMTNATRDPVFWAALDVANHDQPGVGDYCLRCHTPQGWYGGHVVKTGTGTVLDGSNGCRLAGDYAQPDSGNGSGPSDYAGETCHYCHRLVNAGPQGQSPYDENANAWLDDGDCNGAGAPCRRGPYDYPDGGAVDPPPHPWAQSAYHMQSALCGNCHNVSTPDTSAGPLRTLIDGAGRDTGIPFPIERTFREWQQSDFADVVFRDAFGDAPAYRPALAQSRQCQDCHMPVSADPNAYACVLESRGSRAGMLPVHGFAGGNAWVPAILGGEYGPALNRSTAFAGTVTAAQQMLAAAAEVDIASAKLKLPNGSAAGTLTLRVRVTNLSGHKLPTGYAEGRRMWLDVAVHDAANALVAESGAYDAANAALALDAQARVYEVLQGVWNGSTCAVSDASGKLQFHFVLNDCIAKDNRIPPLGFAGGSDPETAPVAQSYASVAPNRLANYDDAPYAFAIPAGTALPLHVTATLYYQTASGEYIRFLRDEAQTKGFPDENTLCSGAPNRPFAVGPQSRTRAEYLYELWNNAANDATQPGHGKSPPQVAGNVDTIVVGG